MCHLYKWLGVVFFAVAVSYMTGNLIGAALIMVP